MPRSKLLAALGLVALLAAVAGVSFLRRPRASPSSELLPYQGRASDLPAREQERFAQLRSELRGAEQIRVASKRWPASLRLSDLSLEQRGQRLYVNYLGIPPDRARLRWLVLVIEPEPTALKDKLPPEDEEHHTLSDGTGLHVSIWSAPNEGPVPDGVLPFPAAENWTQRLLP